MNLLLQPALNDLLINLAADVAIILILFIFVFIGIKKGFMSMLLGFLGGIVTLVATSLLCKPFAVFLGETVGLNQTFLTIFDSIFDGEVFVTPITELASSTISEQLAGMNLPEFIINLVNQIITDTVSAGVSSSLTLQSVLSDVLTDITISSISWFLLYSVFSIIVALLKRFIKIFDKLSLISTLNKCLGGALGLIISLFIVCVTVYVFSVIISFLPPEVAEYVGNTVLLNWIYHNNPLSLIFTMILS